MTEIPHCPSCGKEIPADAPADGLCPRCLLKEGFSTESPTQTGGDGYGRPAPPAPEQLRPLFPPRESSALWDWSSLILSVCSPAPTIESC